MVTCIHNALIYVLTMEKCEGVAIMALKCTAALAQATPYHKLQPGLIEGLIRCIKKFIKQKGMSYDKQACARGFVRVQLKFVG